MKLIGALAFCALFLPVASAQHGTAPNGYYPFGYHGDIFTGEITAANGNEITLTYTKGKKTQTFVGRFETSCNVPKADKSPQRLTAEDFPKGTVLVAFYIPMSKKAAGKKTDENVIFAISFDTWQGQKVPDDRKLIYSCSEVKPTIFQVH